MLNDTSSAFGVVERPHALDGAPHDGPAPGELLVHPGRVAEHLGAVARRPAQGGAGAELLAPVAQHGVQVPARVAGARLRVDREPGLARPGQHVLVVQVAVDERGVAPGIRDELAVQTDGARDQPAGQGVATRGLARASPPTSRSAAAAPVAPARAAGPSRPPIDLAGAVGVEGARGRPSESSRSSSSIPSLGSAATRRTAPSPAQVRRASGSPSVSTLRRDHLHGERLAVAAHRRDHGGPAGAQRSVGDQVPPLERLAEQALRTAVPSSAPRRAALGGQA